MQRRLHGDGSQSIIRHRASPFGPTADGAESARTARMNSARLGFFDPFAHEPKVGENERFAGSPTLWFTPGGG